MNNKINDELMPLNIDDIKLKTDTEKIAHDIIQEDSLDNIKQLTSLFNIAQAKKNALRILKLNNLLDHVSDQMILRFEKRPDQFSHQDLLNYMQVTQSSIDRAQKSLALMDDMPAIVINQQQNNQINVNVADTLNKDERENIMNAIKQVLQKAKELDTDNVSLINDTDDIKNKEDN